MARTSKNATITTALSNGERDITTRVLESTLLDLVDLHLIGKQAHWNVLGPNFRGVHLQLDELVTTARNFADDVAERASALGMPPDARASMVSEGSGLPDFPAGWQQDRDVVAAMVTTLDTLIRRMRPRIDETDKTDLVTQDLLIQITSKLEEAHWMWQAQMST